MPREPRWREILPKLEAFLNAVVDGERKLPAADGKVNVVQLTRELGLPYDDRQYFYKWPELFMPINKVATQLRLQGIPVGGAKYSTAMNVEPSTAFEAEHVANTARNEAEKENVELRAQLRRLVQERDDAIRDRDQLRHRLALIQESGIVFRVDPVREL